MPNSASSFGQIAQSVEQRTENPCVGSSILPLATPLALDAIAMFIPLSSDFIKRLLILLIPILLGKEDFCYLVLAEQ